MTTLTDKQREGLFDLARDSAAMADSMLRSFSGADQADSEAHFCARRVYVAVATGSELEAALAAEDRRWRAYAAEQARKVDAAPKIKRGPCSGQSVISHRWVSPDKFEGMSSHIRIMVRIVMEKNA